MADVVVVVTVIAVSDFVVLKLDMKRIAYVSQNRL